MNVGGACTGSAGSAPGIGGACSVGGDAFFGVDGRGVGGVVGLVVGLVVVVRGGGLPAIVWSRATLEIRGVTQTAALAARPDLTVALTNARRVRPPFGWPSVPPPLGTFGRLSDLLPCEARPSDIRSRSGLPEQLARGRVMA